MKGVRGKFFRPHGEIFGGFLFGGYLNLGGSSSVVEGQFSAGSASRVVRIGECLEGRKRG